MFAHLVASWAAYCGGRLYTQRSLYTQQAHLTARAQHDSKSLQRLDGWTVLPTPCCCLAQVVFCCELCNGAGGLSFLAQGSSSTPEQQARVRQLIRDGHQVDSRAWKAAMQELGEGVTIVSM